MTGTGYDLPRLRSEVVLGPPLRSGPRTVHHVKDPRTGRFYRVGPREHFIMRRMDGRHTVQDIGREYAGAYQRVLGQDSWRQMFTLLGRYQLLDGHADDAVLERIRRDHQAVQAGPRHWLDRRWVLASPDQLCAALARRLRFAFHPLFVLPALLLAVALQVAVWTHPGTLAHQATEHRSWPVAVPASLVLAWLVVTLHELAHGVTCRHFGGQVAEIGFRFRLPMPRPYCRTDDIVLFHRRTARVGTAFAGVLVSLLALVPVAVWWKLSGGPGMSRSLAAGLLLFGSGAALVSLLPFFGLDGCVMLSHALDQADLRRESTRYWRLVLTSRRPGNREKLDAYQRRDSRTYTVYGAATAVFLAALCAAAMSFWYDSLDRWMGAAAAVAVLVGEVAVLVALAGYAARARRTRTDRREAGSG